jgi:hypothetical protein
LGITGKAKTHRGRKVMEYREPKIVENPKSSVMIKGTKSSDLLNNLIKDL